MITDQTWDELGIGIIEYDILLTGTTSFSGASMLQLSCKCGTDVVVGRTYASRYFEFCPAVFGDGSRCQHPGENIEGRTYLKKFILAVPRPFPRNKSFRPISCHLISSLSTCSPRVILSSSHFPNSISP